MQHGIGYVKSQRAGFCRVQCARKLFKLQFYYDAMYLSLRKFYQSILQLFLNFRQSFKTLR